VLHGVDFHTIKSNLDRIILQAILVEALISDRFPEFWEAHRHVLPRAREADEDSWRIRVGDDRILYEIRDEVLAVITMRVRHRRDAYRNSPSCLSVASPDKLDTGCGPQRSL
jgi:mRNA-degrading endonuclease RelE of RelBE toxin-antitoxin system